jgi:PAS domain S-box-containing protein
VAERTSRTAKVGLAFTLAGAALGAFGLMGWFFGAAVLTNVLGDRPPMMPNTGLGLMLAGLGAALRYGERPGRLRKAVSVGSGVLVLALGAATLAEYILDRSLGIDEILYRTGLELYPGRPSPPTAAAFVFLAGALVTFDAAPSRRIRPSECLAIVASFIALATLMGHIYCGEMLYRLPRAKAIGVAIPTGVALLLIGTGSLLERPSAGLMRIATAKGPGGALLRRIGVLAIVLPPALGLIIIWAAAGLGLSALPSMLGITMAAMVAAMLIMLFVTAIPLERNHDILEASQSRLNGIIAIARDAIISVDERQHILIYNEGAEQIFGWTRDEVLGKRVDLLIPERFREVHARHIRHFAAEAVTARKMGERGLSICGLRKNGEEFPAEAAISKLRIHGGHLFTVMLRDVSHRIALERDLVESRAFLQNVLESSTEYSIIAMDLDRRIQMWNEGARRLYGYEAGEIIVQSSDLLHNPEDVGGGATESLHREALEQGTAQGIFRCRRKDGSEFVARVVLTRRTNSQDTPVGYLLISSDITVQQRYLDEQRFLAQVGMVIASTMDCAETIRLVVQASVPFLSDVCAVLLAQEDQVRVEAVHAAAPLSPVVDALSHVGLPEHSMLIQSFMTRQPALIRELSFDFLQKVAQNDEHLRLLRILNPRSMMTVPLLARGRCHGALSFLLVHPSRRYGSEDLRLAEEVGRRLALAVDNALLYEQLRLQGTIATHLSEGVYLIRAEDGVIVYTNPRFEEMFGYAPGELIGKHVSLVNAPGELSPEQQSKVIGEQLERTGMWHGEIEHRKKDGTLFWNYASVSTFDHPRFGNVWVSVHTDISERKRLEAERAQALREKEILLKEIHHRVKNNLQVVSSLFYLQSQRTENRQLRHLLNESRDRVQSIALVHDQLYRSASLANIDFGEYLRQLVSGLEATYGSAARRIDVTVSTMDISLDIEHAVPCGLIISELVSNAFRHAFPGGHTGHIVVSVRNEAESRIVLEVADDGVGITPCVDWRASTSLGLQLVTSLTTQLHGSIELDRTAGTRFTVRFRASPESMGDDSAGHGAAACSAAAGRGRVK